MIGYRGKRTLDLLLTVPAFVASFPLQLGIALIVLIRHGRPVLFTQPRPGLDGELFTLIKFRTMLSPDPERNLITDEQRLTRVGRALRATSLDELPTLWNVVRGDMSLVGPRPQLVRDHLCMTSAQQRRAKVRPGITGWAQVNGRNGISWPGKLALDVEYLERIAPSFDLYILLRTVGVVLHREGIGEGGRDTSDDLGDYLVRKGSLTASEYQSRIERAEEIVQAYALYGKGAASERLQCPSPRLSQ